MRSRLISTLLLLATTSGLPGAAAQEAGKAALRLCWEDTPKLPYLVLEKNQAPRGISVDLVTAILKRAGLAAEAVVWPWKRCLAEIAAGSIDLVPNASYTDDRTKFALFSKPLYRTHMAFFYDTRRFASPPVIEPHDNLKALRIGGVLGFNYQHLKDIPIDRGPEAVRCCCASWRLGGLIWPSNKSNPCWPPYANWASRPPAWPMCKILSSQPRHSTS